MSTFTTASHSSGMPGLHQKSIDPNDCNVPNAGTDGISSLNWSPTSNILISSNWDSTVSCWEVQEQGGRIQANPKAQSKDIDIDIYERLRHFSFRIFFSLNI
jgi:WD40 repeat protein